MSRELYNGEPHASLHMAREGGGFYGEENELGRATISGVHGNGTPLQCSCLENPMDVRG